MRGLEYVSSVKITAVDSCDKEKLIERISKYCERNGFDAEKVSISWEPAKSADELANASIKSIRLEVGDGPFLIADLVAAEASKISRLVNKLSRGRPIKVEYGHRNGLKFVATGNVRGHDLNVQRMRFTERYLANTCFKQACSLQ